MYTIPHVRYMDNGTERLQKISQEIQVENERVAIPAQVRWLSNPLIIRERGQRGVITASSVVFILRGKMVAETLVNKGITAAGVQYKVEPYTKADPTASASSAAVGATSGTSAAIIKRSAATVPDNTDRASSGALWSGEH